MAIAYVGRTYTAKVAASILKRVRCEKCGCQYAYQMIRHASARGHSAYMLDNKGASNRAQGRAEKKLDAQLESCDPVECPDCGWFSREMVELAKRTAWKWTLWGEGKGIDPNAGYPQNRGHFPGMPTPIRFTPGKRPARLTGCLLPLVEEPGGWVSIQPSREILPPFCSVCGEATPERAEIQFAKMSTPPFLTPLCRPCGRKFAFLATAVTYGLMILSVVVLTLIFESFFAGSAEARREPAMPWIMGGGLGLLGGLIGGAILAIVGRRFLPEPVKLSVYDDTRNIYRVRFKNLSFVDRLQKSVVRIPLPRVKGSITEPSQPEDF